MIGHYIQLAHQGISDPLRSMTNGGGSGGSSNPDTRYANLDKLYGIQSQASQYMLDNAMPIVPQVTANSVAMNNEAQDGTLSMRARNQAGADASMAFGQNMDAVNRNTARFGADFNATRMGAIGADAAVGGALGKATAMNKASQWGEDQKWNRNANLYGQVMGMNNGAMSGLSSAGAGFANMNAQQNQMDAANAKGYGQAGAAFSNGLFKKDGGYIEAPGLANGGDAWAAYKAANPVATGSYSGPRRTNPYAAMLMGAAQQALGAGLKDIFSKDSKILSAGKRGMQAIKDYANRSATTESGTAMDSSIPSSDNLQYASSPTADVASGADYAYGGYDSSGSAMDAATSGSAAIDSGSQVGAAADVAAGADYANAGSGASWAADISEFLADGGQVKKKGKKPGLHFALGGLSSSSVAASDKLDNDTLAKMDASTSMQLVKMDDQPKQGTNTAETHAKPITGKPADPDGFGTYNADSRHDVGTGVIKYFGNSLFPGLGTVAGDLVADTIHPVMESSTRDRTMIGDSIDGVNGAMALNPVGTPLSGKYSSEDIVKATIGPALGAPFLSHFLKNGGQARKDMRPGGHVAGPGTPTSDDIPAWLSDGEYVLNAKAVDLVGKERLDQINKAGLAIRKGKADPQIAKKQAGLALGGAVKRKGC